MEHPDVLARDCFTDEDMLTSLLLDNVLIAVSAWPSISVSELARSWA